MSQIDDLEAITTVVEFVNARSHYGSLSIEDPLPSIGTLYSLAMPKPDLYDESQIMLPGKKSSNKFRQSKNGKHKPCRCTQSQCLKLYCDCYAKGELCVGCKCKGCHNTVEFNEERNEAIKQLLEKNPNAFKPKVETEKKNKEIERLHKKGCRCKKSSCLLNYCECYQAKVACSDRCKCESCCNTENGRSDKIPIFLSTSFKTLASDEEEIEDDELPPESYPWYYLTDDVVRTATICLMGQALESEQRDESTVETMNILCKEFGDCVAQVFKASENAQPDESIVKEEMVTTSSED